MNLNGKKVLSYAARLCTIGVVVIFLMRLLGKNANGSVVPILLLAVFANAISYKLYKPK